MKKETFRDLVPYVLGLVLLVSILAQIYHFNLFVSKGPRFTAADRSGALRKSYGFRERDESITYKNQQY